MVINISVSICLSRILKNEIVCIYDWWRTTYSPVSLLVCTSSQGDYLLGIVSYQRRTRMQRLNRRQALWIHHYRYQCWYRSDRGLSFFHLFAVWKMTYKDEKYLINNPNELRLHSNYFWVLFKAHCFIPSGIRPWLSAAIWSRTASNYSTRLIIGNFNSRASSKSTQAETTTSVIGGHATFK